MFFKFSHCVIWITWDTLQNLKFLQVCLRLAHFVRGITGDSVIKPILGWSTPLGSTSLTYSSIQWPHSLLFISLIFQLCAMIPLVMHQKQKRNKSLIAEKIKLKLNQNNNHTIDTVIYVETQYGKKTWGSDNRFSYYSRENYNRQHRHTTILSSLCTHHTPQYCILITHCTTPSPLWVCSYI